MVDCEYKTLLPINTISSLHEQILIMEKIHLLTFIKLPNCRFLPRKAGFIFIEGDIIYSIITGHIRSDIMTMQVINIKDFLYITSIMSCLKEKAQNIP